MLLYERGQFFKSHQDSEKAGGMIGTLVVTLPSSFRGGEMTVEQHGEVMAFRGSRSDLQLVAFYADCRHEVQRVTSGSRVVLTYNLLTEGVATAMPPQVEAPALDALTGALQRHFETPLAGRFGGEAASPDRLVYLLDHEYTARGLRWHLLKGADAARASALRTAAGRLDCEVFLAQADVHETWQCESDPDDWYPSRSRSWRDSWDDFDDDDPGDGGGDDVDAILTDLIDSDIELRNWVASGSKKPAAISSAVRDEELCYTRPSADMSPFQSEHTGFMGNWGNTLDRWYHRAAIVMWPRERTFVIRARASASWALNEVVLTLQRGDQEDARRKVESLLPFWSHTARFTPEPIIHDALRAAAGVADPILASRLLSSLSLETVDPEAASLFEPLLRQFGLQWSEDVLSALAVAQGEAHRKWLAMLPRICEELAEAGEAGWSLARWLAVRQWEWIEGELRKSGRRSVTVPCERGAERAPSATAERPADHACHRRIRRAGIDRPATRRDAHGTPNGLSHDAPPRGIERRRGPPPRARPSSRALCGIAHRAAERTAAGARRLVHPRGARLSLRPMHEAPCVPDRARTRRPGVAARERAPHARPSDDRTARTAARSSHAPDRPPVHARAHEAGRPLRAGRGAAEAVDGGSRVGGGRATARCSEVATRMMSSRLPARRALTRSRGRSAPDRRTAFASCTASDPAVVRAAQCRRACATVPTPAAFPRRHRHLHHAVEPPAEDAVGSVDVREPERCVISGRRPDRRMRRTGSPSAGVDAEAGRACRLDAGRARRFRTSAASRAPRSPHRPRRR
ncbi:MAG: 2OG-Fe(II) oxygenase [Acidobacteriota bacterium]|nr:2OG-Fe(II) oxygenase [Acidobacteriota bacterium]